MPVIGTLPSSRHRRKRVSPRTAGAPQMCSFTKTDVGDSLETLLAEQEPLVQYASAFKEAAIDVSLASDMDVSSLRLLLPHAPLGHCLLLHRILQERSAPRPVVPQSVSWLVPTRLIANANMCDSMRDFRTLSNEFALIVGSLLLSFSIGALLAPATSCANGAACPHLLLADSLLWALCTAAFLLAINAAWVNYVTSLMVSTESFAAWWADHIFWQSTGLTCLILGVTALPVALATRCVIVLHAHAAYPPATVWIVVAVLISANILQWSYWIYGALVTTGVSVRDFPALQAGALGFTLSRRPRPDDPMRTREQLPYLSS